MAKRKFNETEVLEKAAQLFWKQGYEGTSTKQLVKHLGITTGSLYHAFGDKHNLFIKALKHYNTHYPCRLQAMMDQEPDGRKAIINFFQVMMLNFQSDKGAQGCLLTNSVVEMAVQDPAVNQLTRRMLAQQEDAFYRAVKRGQQQGNISSDTGARTLAVFLNNNFQGMNVQIKAHGNVQALEESVELIMKALS